MAAKLAYKAVGTTIDERNRLLMEEMPHVYYIASRIRERLPQHVDIEDLVHAGVIGLLDAYRNYDSSKHAKFNTFARFRIRGGILDSLRQLDWGSRALRKRGRQIAASIAKLEAARGREPVEEEIAADLGICLMELQSTVAQLDGLHLMGQQSASSYGHAEYHDLIESAPSRGGDDPFQLCLEGEVKVYLAKAISELTERDQLILSLYYGDGLTMKEISEVVGLAMSRVSQIHSAAVMTLRGSLSHVRGAAGESMVQLPPPLRPSPLRRSSDRESLAAVPVA